nr:acetyl-CoA carboxylase carboxyltransferase subunit beta [Clostridia bacterium]
MNPLLGLFRKPSNNLENGGTTLPEEPKIKCPECGQSTPVSELIANLKVCRCGHHMRLSARERIAATFDEGSFTEYFSDIVSRDPLGFPGYGDKLRTAAENSGENESVICGTAMLDGHMCAAFVMDPGFMMASLGGAAGERITRLFELADEMALPVIGFTASGGARMQEGIVSLMQMAKTSAAVKAFSDNGGLYVTVLCDPTTGGVTASFAMQGDLIIAEPKALIGFAGRRVIEQTTKDKLPENFQRAEFLLEHGFVDRIVHRHKMRAALSNILKIHTPTHERSTADDRV